MNSTDPQSPTIQDDKPRRFPNVNEAMREAKADIESGEQPTGLDDNPPLPGFYKIKLVRGGPFVPARIRFEPPTDPDTGEPLDRAPGWSAEIGGEPCGEPARLPSEAAGVQRVWSGGIGIQESEYRHMLAVRDWAQNHAPGAPEANPERRIDLNKAPPLF